MARGPSRYRSPGWRGMLFVLAIGLPGTVMAKPLVHLRRTVWGCVNPSIATIINSPDDQHRSDPAWISRTSEMGECVAITSRSEWEPLTLDQDGFYIPGLPRNNRPARVFLGSHERYRLRRSRRASRAFDTCDTGSYPFRGTPAARSSRRSDRDPRLTPGPGAG